VIRSDQQWLKIVENEPNIAQKLFEIWPKAGKFV
jgi:hypothetical protein